MVFRCKRYRICEVTRNVPRRWHVERVFVVQRRWFGCLWVRQRVSQIYFGSRCVGYGVRSSSVVLRLLRMRCVGGFVRRASLMIIQSTSPCPIRSYLQVRFS